MKGLPEEMGRAFRDLFQKAERPDLVRRNWRTASANIRKMAGVGIMTELELLPEIPPWEEPSYAGDEPSAHVRARARMAQEASFHVALLTSASLLLLRRLYKHESGRAALDLPDVGDAVCLMVDGLAASRGVWDEALRGVVLDHATGIQTADFPRGEFPADYVPAPALDSALEKRIAARRKKEQASQPPQPARASGFKRPFPRDSQPRPSRRGQRGSHSGSGRGFPNGGSKASGAPQGAQPRPRERTGRA